MTEHRSDTHRDHPDVADHLGNDVTAAAVWDERYQSRPRIWSGRPNPQLTAEAAALAPGTALDLGCGEGADAIWLAGRGWSVTGLDVSAVALERAAAHAAVAGAADNIEWIQQDLAGWVPDRQFDLVTAQFLHSTLLPWEPVLRLAAAAVRVDGTLLVVGHHPDGLPPWGTHHGREDYFTAEDLIRELGITAPEWRLDVGTVRQRSVTGPDGGAAIVADAVLRATRLASRCAD